MKKYYCSMFLIITFLIVLLSFNKVIAESYPFNGIIYADSLVVHSTASTSTNSVTELAYGTKVIVTGVSGSMYKISYEGGKVGYVAASYVINLDSSILTTDSKNSGIESYKSYCSALVKAGFVESYCPYLYYLHSIHPNWTFKADKIGKTLLEVADNEKWKCSLQTSNKNYWLSTKPQESDYYYVNETVVSAFMDPRNSLFEKTIFQFLNFDQSKDFVNDKALASIAGTGNLSKYYTEFKKAGTDYNVNVLHLMSRSKQEGANKATYRAITGDFTTYVSKDPDYKYNKTARGNSLDGYYNFFNIGAYFANGYSAIGRGLAYAGGFTADDECFTLNSDGVSYSYNESACGKLSYSRPWNSQAKAIAGGADFIATRYIKKGQDTNFYEKFNISSYSKTTMYTNQYMTNIYAPAQESLTLRTAYSAGGLLDSKFEFVIPVYDNMGDNGYVPVNKSTDSSLKMIKINGIEMAGFDPDVIEYEYNVLTEGNSLEVEAIVNDLNSTVSGNGTIAFVDDIAQVNLIVTAEDGSKTTYKITAKKVLPSDSISVQDITSKMKVKITNNYMYSISPSTQVTTLINTVTNNKGVAKVFNKSGQEKKSGLLMTGDKITIYGTAESKTYIICIKGDINSDGIVNLKDFVLVQSHILEVSKLKDSNFYAGDVNFDGVVNLKDFVLVQSHILSKSNL